MPRSSDALIGYTGFVGSTLRRQRSFDAQYRSTTIQDVRGERFDTVFCAAAPAKKWLANKDPDADRENILGLIDHLSQLACRRFVLISTVDVFSTPIEVNEDSEVVEDGLHPYGLHRRLLEKFVADTFEDHHIIRLPGLVGPGLTKNVLYDFLNHNNLDRIESRGVYQFYPMLNLWHDIELAIGAGLRLVHFSTEPLSVREVAERGFGMPFHQELPDRVPGLYDMRSKHASVFSQRGPYLYSKRETLLAIRDYAQTESKRADS